ncbi:MHYT domain-containing protein [Streptodolium elevatio]
MGQIDHFSHGALTPGIAFALSCVGSALCLTCASRAQAVRGAARTRWFVLASVALGGTAIWGMHFVGMLGFAVKGTEIRYDVLLTVASLFLAIVVVGVGMAIAGRPRAGTAGLLLGGVLTGAGVAGMHYVGMAGINMSADIEYSAPVVAASIVIAVVAATAALWAALNVRGPAAVAGASVIMGVAVSGMHYTGMAAISVEGGGSSQSVHGVAASQFLAPVVTGVSLFTVVTLLIVALSASVDEIREETELDARLNRLSEQR